VLARTTRESAWEGGGGEGAHGGDASTLVCHPFAPKALKEVGGVEESRELPGLNGAASVLVRSAPELVDRR